MVGLMGVFVWQGWLFLALMIGIPIIVAGVVGGSKGQKSKK
jgi:hypothetical protein